MNDPEIMSEQPERMMGRGKHPMRGFIIGIVLLVGAWVLIARCGDIVIAAPDNASETYTITAGDPDSIHGFLIWLGVLRITPPEAVAYGCILQQQVPLGIYLHPEGMRGIICVDPNEQLDPEICANWRLIRVELTERTITCRRAMPSTPRDGA